MSVTISSVVPGSAAQKAGILPGETLISINQNDICDILDYRFYETEKSCEFFCRIPLAGNGKW